MSLHTQQSHIATSNLIVRDALGINRRIVAGSVIPVDLLSAYLKAGGKTR